MYGTGLSTLSHEERIRCVMEQLQQYRARRDITVVAEYGCFHVYVRDYDKPIKIFMFKSDVMPFNMMVESSGKLSGDVELVMMELGATIARTLEEKMLEKMR